MRAVLTTLLTTLFTAAVVLAALPASAACRPPAYRAAFLKPVPTRGIDQNLFSRALTLEVNFARCRNGRRPLRLAASVTAIAASHSRFMAQGRVLSHTSTVPGQRRLFSRAIASGLPFRRAAENLLQINRFRFGTATFRIQNAGACRFADHQNRPIAPHSYASLARETVAIWMASPGHRRNLMTRRFRRTGAGIAFDATAPHCGKFYISQDYLG